MYETISTLVSIGKSKEQIPYTFLKSDFIRIEDNRLFLKSDDRVLKLEYEQITKIVLEMNGIR